MDNDDYDKIERLHALKTAGHLTDEEFQTEKARILNVEPETAIEDFDSGLSQGTGPAPNQSDGHHSSNVGRNGRRVVFAVGAVVTAGLLAGGAALYLARASSIIGVPGRLAGSKVTTGAATSANQSAAALANDAVDPAARAIHLSNEALNRVTSSGAKGDVRPATSTTVPTNSASQHQSVVVDTIRSGQGAFPTLSDVVLVNYVARFAGGKEFDRGDKVAIPLDAVVPGFAQGLEKMKRGGKARIEIPSNMAYGAQPQINSKTGAVVIPANSDLVYDVELLDYMNTAQLRAIQEKKGTPSASSEP